MVGHYGVTVRGGGVRSKGVWSGDIKPSTYCLFGTIRGRGFAMERAVGVKVKGGQQGVGTSSSPLVNSLLLRDSKRRGSKVKGEGGEEYEEV